VASFPVYRIVKKKHANKAFDGKGARLFGGRWNSKGAACVYTASSESLAILEMLVHAGPRLISQHYSLFKARLPEKNVLRLKELPDYWRAVPPSPETAEIGDAWLDSGESLALAVPSAIVPRERMYLLNPAHAGFNQLAKKAKLLPFEFDPRLP